MNNKKVVWALYDDGNCSYKKAIEKYFDGQYLVYCVGINEPPFEDTENYKYRQIDLSAMNSKLIKQLSKLPQPDIVLASPPCESWSGADYLKIWKAKVIELNDYAYYEQWNHKREPLTTFFKKQQSRLLGESTQIGLITIIRHFKPSKWVIENPAGSKCWTYQEQFLKFNGIINKTYYNNWNEEFSSKPTIFKSNVNLNLKCERMKSNIRWESIIGYDNRSKVPLELIKEILKKLGE